MRCPWERRSVNSRRGSRGDATPFVVAGLVVHPKGDVHLRTHSDERWRDARLERGAFRLTREDDGNRPGDARCNQRR